MRAARCDTEVTPRVRTARRAAALVVAVVTLMVVMLMTGTLLRSLVARHRQLGRWEQELQAQWLAESALERARVQLIRQPDYAGESWQPVVGAEKLPAAVEIRVERKADGAAQIVVIARYPDKLGMGVQATREAPAVLAVGSSSPESDP